MSALVPRLSAARLVAIDIHYNFSEPERSIIKADITRESVERILEEYLHAQVGRVKDQRPATTKNQYYVSVMMSLPDRKFTTNSDTGNARLACGIIVHVIQLLPRLTIEPL